MQFTDASFLFYFFPICFIALFLLKNRPQLQNIIIICSSVFFYFTFFTLTPTLENFLLYFMPLLIPIFITYHLGIFLFNSSNQAKRKTLLLLGIICNMSLLLYYKYFVFTMMFIPEKTTTQSLLQYAPLFIPIGISFLTFQRISYVFDVYRKNIKPSRDILSFTTYCLLYPQLIAGPIVRFAQIEKELFKKTINAHTIFEGAKFFIIGFAFKIIIADKLFIMVQFLQTQNSFNFLESLLFLFYFSMRIYFDFLGYSLMAIGIAKCMGFSFPENFDSPYQAKSITEFWRKWHMTLSFFIRDYVYIPLGGNRKGSLRTYVNLIIVMLIAGLWHGASLNFLIWGGAYGLLLTMEQILKKKRFTFQKIPSFFKNMYCYLTVSLLWIIFAFPSLQKITIVFSGFFNFQHIYASEDLLNILLLTAIPFFFACYWSFFKKEKNIAFFSPSAKLVASLIIIFLITLFLSLSQKNVAFIYQQF